MGDSTTTVDCIVIGGGHAGLTASSCLVRDGIEHLVLERGRIGQSWRSQRWDSFALNTPGWWDRLHEAPAIEPDDGFPLRDDWIATLEAYARTRRLPLREGIGVTSLDAHPGGRGFVLSTSDLTAPTIRARAVVVASGGQTVARIPATAARLPPDILQLDTGRYRSPDQLPSGAVLVVGGAQSGGQIVEDLLDGGRRVFLATSRVPRGPRRYRGRDILEWLVPLGFFDQRTDALADPAERRTPVLLLSGVGRHGHTLSLQSLAAKGATLLGHLGTIEGSIIHLESDLADNIRWADLRSTAIRQRMDDWIASTGRALPPHDPDPADEPCADPDAFAATRRLDLRAEGISTVIWACGFGPDLGWLNLPLVAQDGTLRVRDGQPDIPGLGLVGFPWQSSRKSGVILGALNDAEAALEQVKAALAAGS